MVIILQHVHVFYQIIVLYNVTCPCISIKLGKHPYCTHPGPRSLTKEKVDIVFLQHVQSVLGDHGLWVPPATRGKWGAQGWGWMGEWGTISICSSGCKGLSLLGPPCTGLSEGLPRTRGSTKWDRSRERLPTETLVKPAVCGWWHLARGLSPLNKCACCARCECEG